MAIEKFTINVSDALLTDLKRRLDATRWPDELENVGWELGSSLSYMKSLADYWRNVYEWRRHEATLNQLPQYRVALEGFYVHLWHVRGKRKRESPIKELTSAKFLLGCRNGGRFRLIPPGAWSFRRKGSP